MTPKSVKKKMKTPAFAAAINRDELRDGAEELGVDFDEHVAFVIAALEERSGELALDGAEPAACAHRQLQHDRRSGDVRRRAARDLARGCSLGSGRWRSH